MAHKYEKVIENHTITRNQVCTQWKSGYYSSKSTENPFHFRQKIRGKSLIMKCIVSPPIRFGYVCVYPLVPIKCFTYNVSLCFDLIISHPPSLAKDWHITISKVFLYQKYNVRTACTTYVCKRKIFVWMFSYVLIWLFQKKLF